MAMVDVSRVGIQIRTWYTPYLIDDYHALKRTSRTGQLPYLYTLCKLIHKKNGTEQTVGTLFIIQKGEDCAFLFLNIQEIVSFL